jgi:predicted Zn finger-like uncharacterized protein
MDVQCERCKTEYEFDDALVSGRGTTVKCTNCGFQFKVKPRDETLANERWTVRTTEGRELVFTTLRELQRAITQRQVGRRDTLRRGSGTPRALATISELEPFFGNSSDNAGPLPAATPVTSTAAGLSRQAVAPQVAPAISPYAQTAALPTPAGAAPHVSPDEVPPRQERLATLRPPAAAPPPPQTAPAHLKPISSPPPRPAPRPAPALAPALSPAPSSFPTPSANHGDPEWGGAHAVLPGFSEQDAKTIEAVLPPPTRPTRRGNSDVGEIETSDPIGVAPIYSMAPQRRRVGGWIVAVILLLGVGLIGYRVGMPYLGSVTKGSASASMLDPRAIRFLTEGEHAIEDGNLELAKEDFDKASALGEKDPRVLLDVARLATVRADIPWLKLRLLSESAEDEVRATKLELQNLSPGMRKAADEAAALAPEDPAAVRVRVDAMRIAGEVALARSSLSKAGTSSQPETSYVLAALDMAEISPPWNTVIDRLRIAAAAEGNLGRARAALVYALARAGDSSGAKAELDRLAALSRPHPLAGFLRAFLARDSPKPGPEVRAAPSASGNASAEVNAPPPRASGGAESVDPRLLIQQAADAENRGQLARAAKLYEDARRIDGNNSEAEAGLGTVSLKQGDPATAHQHFRRALAINPNYVPALVGQADALWQEGDKHGAVAKYKDLIDRFPESAGYPAYVKTRAASSSSAVPGSAGEGSPAAPEAPSPQKPKPSSGSPESKPNELTLPSNIPSDLPGTPP